MAVGAFFGLAHGLHHFELCLALHLDGFVRHLEGGEQVVFAHFLHFAFDHHDVFNRGGHHEVHVGGLELGEGGVDDEAAVDAGHAHFGDGPVEGHVGHGEGCRGGQAGERVGHVDAVGGVEGDVDEGFGVVVVGEEGAQGAVHEPRHEDFVVGGASFAAGEASGEASVGGEFFLVIYRQGHEVRAGHGFLGRYDGGEQHGVAHAQHDRAVGLLGQLTRFQGNGASIAECDGVCHYVHTFSVCFML